MNIKRFLIVGTSGSGKSTLARRISERLKIPHLEIDSLYHQPNWVPEATSRMIEQLQSIARTDEWIVDGNFTMFTRDTLWPRAELVVWLDLPLPLVMARVVRRTIHRLVHRTALWNGNRETIRNLISYDSIVIWPLRTHHANRKKYSEMVNQFANVRCVRLRSDAEVAQFLELLMPEGQS